jgi:protein-S-isoprenylcysteine O-methyltransferase Ste14
MKLVAFALGVVSAAGILASLAATLLAPGVRFWPPGDRSWRYYLHWGLVGLFDVAIVVVAVLDWNRWLLPRPGRLVVGVLLSLLGAGVFVRCAGVFVRSAGEFDADETAGLTGELHTDGPYAYSRNPQYLGMIVGTVGLVALVNSVLVAALGLAHVAWVVLLPFAEEPWLREQFGEAYAEYCETTPRFRGRRSFDRLGGDFD